jgi:Mrp family chromosome partitioning ATPase
MEFITDEIRRACVELEMRHPGARNLLITAPVGGEGTTTIACLYARALAEMNDASVVIVDANLRSPSLHEKFGIAMDGGLRDWEPETTGSKVHSVADCKNLSVMSAGGNNGRSLHMLQHSGRLDRLAASLKQDFSYVLWDTPSLIRYPDGRFLLRHVDGVVVIVEEDGTPLDALSELYGVLANSETPLLGAIMNRCERYTLTPRPIASRTQRRLPS